MCKYRNNSQRAAAGKGIIRTANKSQGQPFGRYECLVLNYPLFLNTMFLRTRFPFLVVLLCLIMISGCGKRYWYRIKLRDARQLYSIKVSMVNLSPQYLSQEFMDELKVGCLKELKRKGYIPSVKDSPVFEFVLRIEVDSFNAGIRNYTKDYAEYVPEGSKTKGPAVYTFRKPVKAIMFNCRLQHFKTKVAVWDTSEDLYFFNDYMKDLGRSDGMIRYLIRTAEPNN
jgi:hypothetical protein